MGNTAVSVTTYDTLGYVRITWDDSDESLGHEAWRVYRRDNTVGGAWVLVEQVDDALPNYTVDDYLAPTGRDVGYAVVEVTTGNVEGAYTEIEVVPLGTNYWLLDTESPALSMRLEHATDDSFTDEYEQETLKLIGRGRKKDVGTRWGFAGSLEAQIKPKNGKTSLQQFTELRSIREANHETYLRTPFGDVFKIGLGDIDFDRVPGTGLDMHLDVSIEYEELA